MLEKFHRHLKSSILALIESKGSIGCPVGYLDQHGARTRNLATLTCIHVCGVIFPTWKKATKFVKSGAKEEGWDCPCIFHGLEPTRIAFWKYADKITGDTHGT